MINNSASQINNNEFGEATSEIETPQMEPGENTTVSNTSNVTNIADDGAVESSALAEMTQQINSLKIQIEERSTQYMRIVADFENYRKRTQKEKEELDIQVKHNTITELLSVIDNFERARSQIKPQNDGEMNIHKSYQGVYKLLVDSLKRLGVSSMRSEGQPFDPNIHEAAMRENTNEHPEGTVLEELVRGYYLGDRVLRHAMVKVSVSQEDTTPIQEESQLPEDK